MKLQMRCVVKEEFADTYRFSFDLDGHEDSDSVGYDTREEATATLSVSYSKDNPLAERFKVDEVYDFELDQPDHD